MNRPLSASSRSDLIRDLESATFDLLIIGGGITGAGIAWDAAKRGMKTVLIERNDFAFGTSSRSTKLIHGGLRYLKQGDVKLVREVGREREWLHRHAPHIVTPMPMLLPIYKGGSLGYFSTSLGLMLYDRLAGVRKPERRRMHREDEAVRLEPMLKREGLKGAGTYYEYRTDDARLTVEVLKTAALHGAWAVNYVEAVEFRYFRSKVCGVVAVDRTTGKELEIRARRVINAAGPWVDPVRAKDHAIKGKRMLLTKGVHLVVDHTKLPVRQAAYFDVPDGRMIFVIPRDGKTYIGTTDTEYNGDPDDPRTTEADRDYLLQAVKSVFPHTKLHPDDVEAMWAGLRPLINEEGKKPSDISRKDEIWMSPSGLITIAGGKLTGFRKMAEKAVDLAAASLAEEVRQSFAPCTTSKETLSGGDSGRAESFEELRDQLIRLGVKKGLSIKTATQLVKLYGSNTADIYLRFEGLENRFEELLRRRNGAEAPMETGAGPVDPPAAEEEDGAMAGWAEAGSGNTLAEDRDREQDAGTAQAEEIDPEPTVRVIADEGLLEEERNGLLTGEGLAEGPEEEEAPAGSNREPEHLASGEEPGIRLPPRSARSRQQPAPTAVRPADASGDRSEGRPAAGPGVRPAYPSGYASAGGPRPAPKPAARPAAKPGPVGRNAAPAHEQPDPDTEWRVLAAQVLYAIEEEMTVHAADFLVRRTGMLLFDRERAEAVALDVIDIMAEKLGWDEERILEEKLRLAKEWEAATVALGKGNRFTDLMNEHQ